MKHIVSENSLELDWSGKWIREEDYETLITEDCDIVKPDGSPLISFRKNPCSPFALSAAFNTLKKVRMITNNRGIASGSKTYKKIKLDGTISRTTVAEEKVQSGVIGFFDRGPRFPYCRACAWNLQNPQDFAKVIPVLKECSNIFEKSLPIRHKMQKEFIDKTSPDFVIQGTVYTTVTYNRNFRTACHKDAGDLEEGFSNMLVMAEGKWTGGVLVLPNYKIGVKLEHGDFIMFDAHEFHGNTPIVQMSKNYSRISLVMYYRTNMIHCLSSIEELKRAKNRKLGESLK